MALNMADLFEHAADAFPERVALIYGDRQVTYRELEDEANRLAHHLAAQGIGPGRPRRPLRAQLGRGGGDAARRDQAPRRRHQHQLPLPGGRARAITCATPTCAALVHDQDLAPVVDAVVPARTAARVDRRQTTARRCAGRVGQRATSARAAADDVYIIYTGGTTGHPKGVMWRHEDIWRTLGGGIDFVTGEPLDGRVGAVPRGRRGRRHGPDGARAAHPRRRHGGHAGLPVRRGHGRDPAEVRSARDLGGGAAAPGQRAVDHRRRDGPAADGGAGGAATTTRPRWSPSTPPPRCSRPRSRRRAPTALPNVFISEAIGSTETGLRRHRVRQRRMTSSGAAPRSTPGPTSS